MTFKCATNLTGYILFFETKLSVDETFDGMMVSLNLKASIKVNGTAFTCRASNGDATEPAYVYVQGQYYSSMYRPVSGGGSSPTVHACCKGVI